MCMHLEFPNNNFLLIMFLLKYSNTNQCFFLYIQMLINVSSLFNWPMTHKDVDFNTKPISLVLGQLGGLNLPPQIIYDKEEEYDVTASSPTIQKRSVYCMEWLHAAIDLNVRRHGGFAAKYSLIWTLSLHLLTKVQDSSGLDVSISNYCT